MKYKIIATEGISELAKEVQKAIDDGWKPLGGVATAANNKTAVVMQAMIQEYSK